MTPSFVSAHMTLMNIDYKYFAGSKDPINIINKYRMRGFGCWLNKNELETYIKYNYEVPFWNNIFNINPNKTKTYNTCFGPLNIHSRLFKPRLFNMNIINNDKIATDDNYHHCAFRYLTEPEYYIIRYNNYNPTFGKYKYINEDTGYIEPLDRNAINTSYNYTTNHSQPISSTNNIIDNTLPPLLNI
jgi:hypothetical protein